jgi:hypothetical protein
VNTARRVAAARAEHDAVIRAFVSALSAIEPAGWHRPIAAGKWSPSAVALHVTRAYELGRDTAAGAPGMRLRVSPARAWLARQVLLPVLLVTHRFPSGVDAPSEVMPDLAEARDQTAERALARLGRAAAEAEAALVAGAGNPSAPRATHAYFGGLRPLQALRLLSAHTRHHTRALGLIEPTSRAMD